MYCMMDILNAQLSYRYQPIYIKDRDYIIYDQNSGALFVSVGDMSTFIKLYRDYHLEQYDLYHVKQRDIVLYFKQHAFKKIRMECHLFIYDSKQSLPLGKTDNIEIKLLDESYADFVGHHYHTVQDQEYICDRIKNQCMWGLFVDHQCAGFIGIHDEGSMGMLEIVPEYQRKGYGYLLEAFLINEMLRQGKIPYCEVVVGNQASVALQLKLGLKMSNETYYWLGE